MTAFFSGTPNCFGPSYFKAALAYKCWKKKRNENCSAFDSTLLRFSELKGIDVVQLFGRQAVQRKENLLLKVPFCVFSPFFKYVSSSFYKTLKLFYFLPGSFTDDGLIRQRSLCCCCCQYRLLVASLKFHWVQFCFRIILDTRSVQCHCDS